MEITDELKETIELYINGELENIKTQEFEAKLRQQPGLKAKVDEHINLHKQLIEKGAYYAKRDALKEKMKSWGAEHFKQEPGLKAAAQRNVEDYKKSSKSIIKYLIPVAALAAALILIPVFFPGNVSPQNLANTNYEVYDASFTTKSEVGDLSQAESFYNDKKWQKAINIFSQHPNNPKAQIAKANSEYQLQQYDKAIATLQPVVKKHPDYSDAAWWYIAMSYLSKQNKIKAVDALGSISEDSRFYEKGKNIIKQLDY